MNFEALGLSAPILKALDEQSYKTPTAIQAKAIPLIIEGKDVMAAAQTGTGKTAGFTLPILDRLSQGERVRPAHIRTLVLTPTRELAAQVAQSVATYSKYLSITSSVVFGGVKINPQIARLRKGIDILVATPGRLLDLYQQNAVNFSQVEVLVLDEADRMLDMGFIHDIKKIIACLPRKRQNLLFSATFSNDIRQLAKGLMHNPVEVSVTPPNSTVNTVEQWVHPVDKKQKTPLLSHLIWEGKWEQVLVFTRTKHGANRLAEYLIQDGLQAVAIHGNKSQGARTRALADFKAGKVRVLVATDIAARGLDIELLPHVVNFDLPHVAEDYIHRIGRTGRAGASGQAVSLVSADESQQLADIERLIKQKLTRKEISGFEAKHTVPTENTSHRRPPRSNQFKKPDVRYRSKEPSGNFRSEKDNRSKRSNEWVGGRNDRSERSDRPTKTEWTPRPDRSTRTERTSKPDFSGRTSRPSNNRARPTTRTK
ncbi:MAG: ATP-dependent RNA helicase [Gammaproteobacteria bacterium RIFCSPHIGHO2_12_FULL_38_11]|nr:MAG: ATP-dependent RNA helicase [Gammaproteobacteria bacterium RIFCSPHIGHO2_12_FULL_38_11]